MTSFRLDLKSSFFGRRQEKKYILKNCRNLKKNFLVIEACRKNFKANSSIQPMIH